MITGDTISQTSLSVTYIYGILLNNNDVGHSGQLWVRLWCINLFWYLIASCFKNDSTIGLISLASFSDNDLCFRDVRRTHASFIREAGNFANKSEYAWLNTIIYLYIAQKNGISWNFKDRPLYCISFIALKAFRSLHVNIARDLLENSNQKYT